MPQDLPEERLRAVLTGEYPGLTKFRRSLKRMPSDPRCKLCAAPFAGPGGAILRHFGFARFAANPALCENCIRGFRKSGVTGAEIPITLLFADVRGSTGIAEKMRPIEYRTFLDRFYRIGSEAILGHDGLVDKLVGDEVIGLFFGGVTGPGHAAAGIEAAVELMARSGRPDATPVGSIPVGAGVHTGEAYVGTTGPIDAVDDFTALGDAVNATARLASTAGAGEILVSVAAATAAGRDITGLERHDLGCALIPDGRAGLRRQARSPHPPAACSPMARPVSPGAARIRSCWRWQPRRSLARRTRRRSRPLGTSTTCSRPYERQPRPRRTFNRARKWSEDLARRP